MRERIKDSERLKHILEAMNVIIENKEKHSFEEITSDKIIHHIESRPKGCGFFCGPL